MIFSDITALVGDTATLVCPIVSSCGPLHSIKWYREDERIAVLAESPKFEKIEGNMKDRYIVFEKSKNGSAQKNSKGFFLTFVKDRFFSTRHVTKRFPLSLESVHTLFR